MAYNTSHDSTILASRPENTQMHDHSPHHELGLVLYRSHCSLKEPKNKNLGYNLIKILLACIF